jgi:hypothetical protein
MSQTGETGLDRSSSLYDWAKGQGTNLQGTADTAGTRAGTLADATMPTDPRLMAEWEKTYMPLYKAQAADAQRMIGELPRTEEQYAGKFAADTGQAMDATKATQNRTLQSYGLKAPGVASTALDMTAANQRAAGIAAASETGRLAARNESRGVTGQAIQTGTQIPQVGAQQSTLGMQAGQQQVALPATAISTTAGAYSPSLGFYQASYPYMAQWGQTMSNAYNQNLASFNANENAGGGAGAMAGAGLGALGSLGGAYLGNPSTKFSAKGGMITKMEEGGPVIKFDHGGTFGSILKTAGSIGGSILGGMYGGPAGAMVGGKIGSALGGAAGDVVGGDSGEAGDDLGNAAIDAVNQGMPRLATGGDVTPPGNRNFVSPSMSASKGAITDDVPARLNAGEFVLPKDVVSWLGEEKLHKLIMSTREKQKQTVAESGAEPELSNEAASGGAIQMMPPKFISEGAHP